MMRALSDGTRVQVFLAIAAGAARTNVVRQRLTEGADYGDERGRLPGVSPR